MSRLTYNADQVLIPHIFDGDIVHEARNNCSWASVLAKVYLLMGNVFNLTDTFGGYWLTSMYRLSASGCFFTVMIVDE
jgi:hypothetical protein